MTVKKMKVIRNCIMIVSMVCGFLIWLTLPLKFKNTPFMHVGNGEFGNKYGALIILLLPLFALFHSKQDDEVHTDDPIEREKLVNEYEKREAKNQVINASFIGIVIVAVLGVASLMLN